MDHRPKNFIDHAFQQRRTLERALADLRAEYERNPTPELAQSIRYLEAEIEERKKRRSRA